MSNMIIIPDVHGRKFWRESIRGHEEDKIIFLGDYVDPYEEEGISPNEAYRELLDIIELKKAHPDNVVLLLGNHDLGYLDCAICSCRMDMDLHDRINMTFEENLDLFNIIHIEEIVGGKILFSHAGIAENWIRHRGHIVGDLGDFRPEHLNELLHGDLAERDLLFLALCDVSWFRGGPDRVGSPVWADVQEYMEGERFLGGYLHIFGHTLHDGGPINVRNHGICLDCAQAFFLNNN